MFKENDIENVTNAMYSGDISGCDIDSWLRIKRFVNEAQKTPTNNGSTPCQYFRREKIRTGESHYHSVPWCNHEPSQRAVP